MYYKPTYSQHFKSDINKLTLFFFCISYSKNQLALSVFRTI